MPLVEGYGRGPTIRMTKLLVRAALAGLLKTQLYEQPHDFLRFQNGQTAHGSGDSNLLGAHELRLKVRLAVFKQQLDHLAQILVQLIERARLCVGTRKSRNVSDEKACIRAFLDDGCEGFHDSYLDGNSSSEPFRAHGHIPYGLVSTNVPGRCFTMSAPSAA